MPRVRLARVAALAATGAALAAGALAAPAHAATALTAGTVTEIPLPTFSVQVQCGPRNDIITVDPAWLAAWGDKVTIYPNSLTFQGGKDGDAAKPAGQILPAYAGSYVWAGSSALPSSYDRTLLYPGTVTPIVDANTPCSVAAPTVLQHVNPGRHDDTFSLSAADAEHWTITSVTWQGNLATVNLATKPGFVGPNGVTTMKQYFPDQK